MSDWFTIEQIEKDTFALSEYRHWEETHSYLLLGTQRALLIDTGLGVEDIGQVVRGLTDLPVIAAATHVHWDHIGGHRCFDHIAVHEAERDWLSHFPIPLAVVKQNLLRNPCDFPPDFDPEEYRLFTGDPQQILRDDDVLDMGGRRISALHTPGHSPGHCCFYEPARRTLYSGDLIYLGCLDAFYPTTNPVQFYRSVQKIRPLAVERILPGHHALPVPPTLTSEIEAAFRSLEEKGELYQGSGLFDFGLFQIHI